MSFLSQGRDRYFEHVKSYSLSFSDDRRTWREYQEQGEKKVCALGVCRYNNITTRQNDNDTRN